MKRTIHGAIITMLGLLIALGPKFLFKVCGSSCCCAEVPHCHWSAQALLGIGMMIAALGLCFLIFNDVKTQLGLLIGVFFSGIIAIGIPHTLIGGCPMETMACHKVAFPAVTIVAAVLLAYTVVVVVLELRKKTQG